MGSIVFYGELFFGKHAKYEVGEKAVECFRYVSLAIVYLHNVPISKIFFNRTVFSFERIFLIRLDYLVNIEIKIYSLQHIIYKYYVKITI